MKNLILTLSCLAMVACTSQEYPTDREVGYGPSSNIVGSTQSNTVTNISNGQVLNNLELKELKDGSNVSLKNLRGADLSDRSLKNLQARKANLADSDFSGTNLSGANLKEALLTGANFNNTVLKDADLSNVFGWQKATWAGACVKNTRLPVGLEIKKTCN